MRLTITGVGKRGDEIRGLNALLTQVGSTRPLKLQGWVVQRGPGHWTTGSARAGLPCKQIRLLEPGDYLLTVRVKGYRPFERQVRLDALQVLDVDVALTPE